MSSKIIVNFLTLGILIILLTSVSPFLIWMIKEPVPGDIVILENLSAEDSEDVSVLKWPFYNRKYENILSLESPELLSSHKKDFFFTVGDVSEQINSDNRASHYADLIKAAAINSRGALFNGSSLSETHHGRYLTLIEEFLNIKHTGWSILYIRNRDMIRELPWGIRQEVLFQLEHIDNKPFLLFSHSRGNIRIMVADDDFSGKIPLAELFKRKVEMYGWIPVYEAEENVNTYGSIDLHLTQRGQEQYKELKLPDTIPLVFHRDVSYNPSCFFVLPINENMETGSYRKSFKEWYFLNMALFRSDTLQKVYWKMYLPLIRWLLKQERGIPAEDSVPEITFKIVNKQFIRIINHSEWEDFFIKGVNLGTALPGKWFTQFPEDEDLYIQWFTQIKAMNLNTIRIYTLLPPSFYRALYLFNRSRGIDPLFLIQEIWPEEHPPGNNYLNPEYNESFREEISMVIDAVHGEGQIPSRQGRAWGTYRSDVSPWVIAYVVGRELEPDEVQSTDQLNRGFLFKGRYISVEKGSPTEAWLAWSCNFAAEYENDNYNEMRPLGIVSWPTLDTLHHPSEWTDPELKGKEPYNDRAEININHISLSSDFTPGFFGAYHIYPNYPDFMNNQSSYATYQDRDGSFRYGGYLQDFIRGHQKYPALVAEYGISTSMVPAHLNPDGYHHGGLSEAEQGAGIIRMTEAIKREGYAGAVIFEWIDEWAKKTWTTEPFMIPYDRQANWHNALDPEQNYGIMGMKSGSIRDYKRWISSPDDLRVATWGDEAHLYIKLDNIPTSFLNDSNLYLGFDTYDRQKGIFHFPHANRTETSSGLEFLATIDLSARDEESDSFFYAVESYNIGKSRYAVTGAEGQSFLPINMLVNRAYIDQNEDLIPEKYSEWGRLSYGNLEESRYCLERIGSTLTVRIPWGLLNVSDPSSGRVLFDNRIKYSYPGRDVLQVMKSESLIINGLFVNRESEQQLMFPMTKGVPTSDISYNWPNWNIPDYIQRSKSSYDMLKDYFH